ncbi:MAG TPA: UDP-N-acetylmuramoyl-L-alanine--D-glutamate ligase [Candidatus Saccharimonadales bacterium]
MKIAIAGFGIEGKASYNYWNTPENQLTIVDEREELDNLPQDVLTILGQGAFSKLADFDLIIRSPSINPKRLPYGEKVWSATNEFFAKCPAPIIGVTGTKGKGTTCSLITGILRAAGKTVHLVGNIGVSALEELPQIQSSDVVVFELSSFQLWDIQRSPHVAVVLALEPDHLDVHEDMDDYVNAKANIVKYQTVEDMVVFNVRNQLSSRIAARSAGEQAEYPFAIDEYASSLKLPGKHNQENAAAAIAAIKEFDIDDEAIREGLSSFSGLPHRLKFVAEKQSVRYYDDSIATTPGSAIAALDSFLDPKVLILGGVDKGGGYKEIVERCKRDNTKVIAIGRSGQEIQKLCEEAGVDCVSEAGDMLTIVKSASAQALPGSVVILSPASSSFDMFKNYADRGDQFVAAVMNL